MAEATKRVCRACAKSSTAHGNAQLRLGLELRRKFRETGRPPDRKKRRFDQAIANGEVIEIPSDDDEAPQVAPDAATQARLDAAADP